MTRFGIVVVAFVFAVFLVAGAGSPAAAVDACPTSNPPNELVLAGGSGQPAQLGQPFPAALQVQLANTNDCPLTGDLAGYDVDFDAPGSGPSGIFAGRGSHEAVVGTNGQGAATAPAFTANFAAGSYTVDAHSDFGTVELNLSNTAAGLAASIAATAGTPQAASGEQPLRAAASSAGHRRGRQPRAGGDRQLLGRPRHDRGGRELPRRRTGHLDDRLERDGDLAAASGKRQPRALHGRRLDRRRHGCRDLQPRQPRRGRSARRGWRDGAERDDRQPLPEAADRTPRRPGRSAHRRSRRHLHTRGGRPGAEEERPPPVRASPAAPARRPSSRMRMARPRPRCSSPTTHRGSSPPRRPRSVQPHRSPTRSTTWRRGSRHAVRPGARPSGGATRTP